MFSQDWDCTLKSVTEEILKQADVFEPPVDPIEVARSLKIRIVLDDALSARAYSRDFANVTQIVLGPENRYERLCFATAHEIGESHAGMVCERSPWDPEWFQGDFREHVANEMAGQILCPRRWFRRAALDSDFDLLGLKKQFSTASHEVIARRMLAFDIPTAITVFDHGRISKRLTNFEGLPGLLPLEQKAWRQCHEFGFPVVMDWNGLRVQAWPVHETNWKREIVRTTQMN